MFSTLPKAYFNFSSTFDFSSANAFNLDQSNILSSGNGLNDGIYLRVVWEKEKNVGNQSLYHRHSFFDELCYLYDVIY